LERAIDGIRAIGAPHAAMRSTSFCVAYMAEGSGRQGDVAIAHFCSMAMGSANEVEHHLLPAKDMKALKPADYQTLAPCATELKRVLTALIQKLKADR
jgi:four helix bundle protein